MMSDFSAWVSARQSRFEEVLKRLLPQADATPQRLHAAMRYSVLEGGKRVRPLLAYAAGELAGASTHLQNGTGGWIPKWKNQPSSIFSLHHSMH